MPEPGLPSGTVTFLFTDIEGSTRLIQELGEGYPAVLTEHRALIESPAVHRAGRPFGTEGDAVFIAFPSAPNAIEAAVEAQRALAGHPWPDGHSVRVRMGLHTGEATVVGDDYVGLTLHQAARIMAAGHGGQVLVSSATAELARGALPNGLELRDLGEHRLKDLAMPERIFQVVGVGLEDRFPALKTLQGRPNNLPVQLTSFVGRDELAEASRLMTANRLLTLTGPGGTGKTRLALQLAAEMSDSFPDGVFFVGLDATRDPELVPTEILRALDRTAMGTRGPLEQLIDQIAMKRMLLVLDNFEQIVEGGPVVAELLRAAPDLKVVVTSRIPLGVSGEQVYPVPALDVPPASAKHASDVAHYESVRLFAERAMAAQPTFHVTDENSVAVSDIVRRLDGLPLAIELAASRLRVFPVEALRTRLDQRLGVLTGGARDLPDRQRTLRGAIDWSHDLLDEPDRRLFARFSVFAGGAYLADAERVCDGRAEGPDVIDGLGSLVEKSLLRTEPTATVDARFAMLATIQEYAAERLAEMDDADAIRRRHADDYLALVEASDDHLTGPDSTTWLDRLEGDHDDIRAAIDWAMRTGEAEIALRFVAAIWRFWQIRGYLNEGRERIDRVLAMQGASQESDDLLARAYGASGSIDYWRGDQRGTHLAYAAALEHARACGDSQTIANALYDLAFVPDEDPSAKYIAFNMALPLLEEAIARFQELGDAKGIAKSTWALAIVHAGNKEPDSALEVVEQALAAYRELGDRFGIGWSLHMRAIFKIELGRADEIDEDLREALQLFSATGDRTGIVGTLLDFSQLSFIRGQEELVVALRAVSERIRRETGMEILFEDIPAVNWTLPERPVNDPSIDAAWEAGEGMTTEEAVAYALSDPGS